MLHVVVVLKPNGNGDCLPGPEFLLRSDGNDLRGRVRKIGLRRKPPRDGTGNRRRHAQVDRHLIHIQDYLEVGSHNVLPLGDTFHFHTKPIVRGRIDPEVDQGGRKPEDISPFGDRFFQCGHTLAVDRQDDRMRVIFLA